MRVRLFSGLTAWTATGVVYETGLQSPTELNQSYRFYMQFDFDNSSMTGFYSLGEAYQEGGASATKFLLGSVAIDPSLTAEEVTQNYGLGLMMSSGSVIYDSVTVVAVPEAQTTALLGLGVLGCLASIHIRKKGARAQLNA